MKGEALAIGFLQTHHWNSTNPGEDPIGTSTEDMGKQRLLVLGNEKSQRRWEKAESDWLEWCSQRFWLSRAKAHLEIWCRKSMDCAVRNPTFVNLKGRRWFRSTFHHPHCHHYHHLGNIYRLMARVQLTAKLAHSLLDHMKFQGPQHLQYTCMHVHLKYDSETEELKFFIFLLFN